MFILGKGSRSKLAPVNDYLEQVVKTAISITSVDFSVIEGERTAERQLELWLAKASKFNGIEKGKKVKDIIGTGISKHQICDAVDLGAYVGGSIRWDFGLYYEIAKAMQEAAVLEKVRIRWGSVWDRCLNDFEFTVEEEVNAYVARRQALGRKAFLDGPHFELI